MLHHFLLCGSSKYVVLNFIHNWFQVVMFAKDNGNRAAGREFKVDEQCIRRCRGQEGVLKKTPNKKRTLRHGLVKFPKLEVELSGWIKAKRQQGTAVSTSLIRLKAKFWAKDQGINFKASLYWCQRFMKQHDLFVRKKTTVAQKLPEEHEEKVVNFHRYIIKERKEHKFLTSLIGNAD